MEPDSTRPIRRGESAFGLILLILAVGFLWQSWRIAGLSSLSSPGAFPLAASGVMVIAAVIVVLRNLRSQAEHDGSTILPFNVLVFAALIVVYALLIEPMGFLPASFLFLLLGTRFLHGGGWGFAILVSILSLVAIYVLFRIVFQVVLPEGIVPEAEWLRAIGSLFSRKDI